MVGERPLARGPLVELGLLSDFLEHLRLGGDLGGALGRCVGGRVLGTLGLLEAPGGITMEAVRCLMEAVGIDDDGRALVHDRIFEDGDIRDGASALLGVIIGLLAAELAEA